MVSEEAPHVTVVVPHFNQPEALRLCLQSLARQSLRAPFDVIVADNASDDQLALRAALEAFSPARLVLEPRRGAAHARNAAMAASRAGHFAFIDADCVADADWLKAGLAGLRKFDLIGGHVRVTVADANNPSPTEAFELVFAFRQRAYVRRKRFAVTANLFARREAAMAIGPFAHGVAEDVDWCRRARALGFRLAFNARSIIGHPARRTWIELARKWDRLVAERWNGYGARGLAGRTLWAGLAAATALSAAPHLITVLTTRRLKRLRDRAAAAGVLVRIRWRRARRMIAAMRQSA